MKHKTAFSIAAQTLATESIASATLTEAWTYTPQHPYSNAHYNRLRIYQSARGAWGIVNNRTIGAAQAELFVSRLAAIAGIPVAPTFAFDNKPMGCVISVIPFRSIVHSRDLPYDKMKSFMRHASACLPFFLWLGQDMDRAHRNLCMNAETSCDYAEFDFENSDLTRVFEVSRLDPERMPAGMSGAAKQLLAMKYEHNVVAASMEVSLEKAYVPKPILRRDFEEGLARVRALTSADIERVLDVVDMVRPISPVQREAVTGYLNRRKLWLEMNYRFGKFDGQMIGGLPFETPKMCPIQISKATYSFE